MHNSRLAIVEDEASLREDLIAFFKMRGMQVSGFASAESFIAMFEAGHFDAVILDIGLPGKSGIEIANAVRRQSSMPILVLTSHDNHQTHLESLQAGADVFLSKSSPLEIIESTVINMLIRYTSARIDKGLGAGLGAIASPMPPSALSGQARKSDQQVWRLMMREMVLKTPDHASCMLTFTEALFLKPLLLQANEAITRAALVMAMEKEVTASNMRNLDTYANRLRRKVLAETQIELPIRSAYSMGYVFFGIAHVLQ